MKLTNGVASFLVAVALVAGPACGGGSHGSTLVAVPDSPAMRAYPALRWVPADQDLLLASHSLRQDAIAMRELAGIVAAIIGESVDRMGAWYQRRIGFNPLSADDLRAAGIDVDGSAVLYGQGVAATLVVKVRDPATLAAALAQAQGGDGTTTSQVDGIEVTSVVDNFLHLQWATIDGWMWVHIDLGSARDDAWLTASRTAAGAGAADANLTWAMSSTAARTQGGQQVAPVLGYVLVDKLMQGPGRLALQAFGASCGRAIEPLARVAFAGAGDAQQFDVVAVADLDDGNGIGTALAPEPAGWSQAGATPALQGAVNVDARAIGTWVSQCAGDDLADAVAQAGIVRGRMFVDSFSTNGFKGDLGVALDLARPDMFAGVIDQIPMRSMFESKTRFGTIDGYTLSVPLIGKASYALDATHFFAGKGTGFALDKLVGTPGPVTGNLLHVTARPAQLSADTWEFILSKTIGGSRSDRTTMIDFVRRWTLAEVAVDLIGNELVVQAHTRRTP